MCAMETNIDYLQGVYINKVYLALLIEETALSRSVSPGWALLREALFSRVSQQ